MKWTNEREIPLELLELLDSPNLPDELRQEITKARDEITTSGAVTYPTKARVEFYINKYKDFLDTLLNQNDKTDF